MKRFIPLTLCLTLNLLSLALFAQTEGSASQVPRAIPIPDEPSAGIGAVLAIQDGQLVVTQTMPGGAAAPVVRAGDRVVKIDGAAVSATLAENIERIRSAAGVGGAAGGGSLCAAILPN